MKSDDLQRLHYEIKALAVDAVMLELERRAAWLERGRVAPDQIHRQLDRADADRAVTIAAKLNQAAASTGDPATISRAAALGRAALALQRALGGDD